MVHLVVDFLGVILQISKTFFYHLKAAMGLGFGSLLKK